MKIQQLFVGISRNISIPEVSESLIYLLFVSFKAECKMFFAKGHQISSDAPRQSMPPWYWSAISEDHRDLVQIY